MGLAERECTNKQTWNSFYTDLELFKFFPHYLNVSTYSQYAYVSFHNKC